MNPQEFDIHELIPQRPPMIMIDKLVYVSENTGRGILYILESNLFCENKCLPESGLIEFIAQTAAAFMGYRKKTNNSSVSEGYIGAVKNLSINYLPPINNEIQSEIVVENEIVGYTIITGKVFFAGQIIAACEMRILTMA
jgi:predicted hotdog family 3-hydroxylacyl-ACP dehydratase